MPRPPATRFAGPVRPSCWPIAPGSSRPARPLAFDSLAAAYAALGEFDAAVRAAETGIQVAQQRGLQSLVLEMRDRLQLYQGHKAFTINP